MNDAARPFKWRGLAVHATWCPRIARRQGKGADGRERLRPRIARKQGTGADGGVKLTPAFLICNKPFRVVFSYAGRYPTGVSIQKGSRNKQALPRSDYPGTYDRHRGIALSGARGRRS